MSSLGRRAALAALLAGATFAAGCGETVIDSAKTEAALEQDLSRSTERDISSVDCPSDVEVKTGATFECEVNLAGGERQTALLKILNEDADVAVTDLRSTKKADEK